MIYRLRAQISVHCAGLVLACLLTGLLTGCPGLPAKYSELQDREAADKAAAQSLKTLRKLITEQNYKQMGFESLEEAQNAALDNAIQDYAVDLASLKEFRTGDDPGKLLLRTRSLVYPVLVNGEVRTSITIAYRDKAWEAQSFGRSNFIKLLADRLAAQSKTQNLTRRDFFIVRVPAFNLVFLGYRMNRKFMLLPILHSPEYGISAGIPTPADIVFTRLRAAARSYDDLPR
jgi:hypothetical protein